MVMTNTVARRSLLIMLSVAATGCDPLVAPVASTISISAAVTALPVGGTTEVAAYVVEEAGTLVHDGTVVRFSATLGRVEPEEAETKSGIARATFIAGSTPGTAQVTATSGRAESAEDPPNVVEIVIGP